MMINLMNKVLKEQQHDANNLHFCKVFYENLRFGSGVHRQVSYQLHNRMCSGSIPADIWKSEIRTLSLLL